MAHLYVIAGHGAGDPGAVGNGYSEAERVRALAQRIKDLGGNGVTLHPFSDDAYASGAISTIDIPGDWCIAELHMDSAGSGARGGHVIIKDGFDPDGYDNALAELMRSVLPGRANLIVGRSDLANPNRAASRGLNYRLVENGFISSAEDVAVFNARIDDLARGYLSAFGLGSAPAQPAPQQDPGDPENDAGLWYRAHVAELGWLDAVRDGQAAGTTGHGLQLEALKIDPPDGIELDAKMHVQDVGWKTFSDVAKNDPVIGTEGRALRAEAMELDVKSSTTGKRLWYQVHLADVGWTGWVEQGYAAGTVGIGKAIEAVRMKLA